MQLCSPREQMGRKVQTGYMVYIGRLHGQGEPAYAVEGVQDHGPTGTLCARLAGQLELSSPACVHAPMFIHDNTIHAGMPHESLACRGTNQKGNFRIGKGSTDRIQGRDAHHRVTRTSRPVNQNLLYPVRLDLERLYGHGSWNIRFILSTTRYKADNAFSNRLWPSKNSNSRKRAKRGVGIDQLDCTFIRSFSVVSTTSGLLCSIRR